MRESKRSNAARLQNASVSDPRRGRRPAARASFSAQAPHSSLPWISALSRTCLPGAPESKCQTPGVSELPRRSADRSGQARRKGRGLGVGEDVGMEIPMKREDCIGMEKRLREAAVFFIQANPLTWRRA
ncbi:hypothetical protein D3C71_1368860 [compost metagenome]